MRRWSTEISGLDKLLAGGLPQPGVYLIEESYHFPDNPEFSSTYHELDLDLLLFFAIRAARRGEQVLVASLSHTRAELKGRILDGPWEWKESLWQHLTIVDLPILREVEGPETGLTNWPVLLSTRISNFQEKWGTQVVVLFDIPSLVLHGLQITDLPQMFNWLRDLGLVVFVDSTVHLQRGEGADIPGYWVDGTMTLTTTSQGQHKLRISGVRSTDHDFSDHDLDYVPDGLELTFP